MIDEVYNKKILGFAGNISRLGALKDADASASKRAKICGSQVRVWIKFSQGVVSDYGHEVKACALGQASASILANNIIGASVSEVETARSELQAMLTEKGPVPTGRFSDLEYLEPVRDHRARHASTLLAFDAVIEALNSIKETTE